MIAVERAGRLGNQLFQFAFGIAASKRLGTSFVMQDDELRRVFTLGSFAREPARSLQRLRFRAGNRLRRYRVVKLRDESFDDPAEALERLSDRTIYSGLFHAERFFAGARDEVLSAFCFRPEQVRRFRERYADLLATRYVCCHVRRADFLQWEGVALPVSYYLESLEALAPGSDVPIVFVGDDLDGLRTQLASLPGVRFEQNDEPLDLLLLAHAADVVTANSTFSWWGAYLNRTPGKRVLVPWFEDLEPQQRVIPEGWRHLTVRRRERRVTR